MPHTDLTWINHSGFMVEHGHACLISDPWLFGNVFANGWSLQVPSTLTGEMIGSRATHIWVSHEHPDHFHPPSLKSIPESQRSTMTLLYQETSDRRVARYCEGLGFRVLELKTDRWYELDDDNQVLCHKVGFNSALIHRTSTEQLINVNDCDLDGKDFAALNAAAGSSSAPRVLFTQFSYAHWCGNRGSVHMRQAEARRKLSKVEEQVGELAPQKLVLAASYIYYGHKENFFANDAINTPSTALRYLVSHSGLREQDIVVLIPGQTWDCHGEVDSSGAAKRYEAALRNIRPARSDAPPLTHSELDDLLLSFRQRIDEYFGRVALFLRVLYRGFRLRLRIPDAGAAIELSPFHVSWPSHPGAGPERFDLELSSDALRFCLRDVYGFNSIHVASRFQVGDRRGLDRALAMFILPDHIKNGRPRWQALTRVLQHRVLLAIPAAVISRLPVLRRFRRFWWSGL